MENVIYMDHAATTPTDPEVVETMLRWFTDQFGNPATLYSLGADRRPGARGVPRQPRGESGGPARRDLLHERGHRVQQLGDQRHGRRAGAQGPPHHQLDHRAPRGPGTPGVPSEEGLRRHPRAGGLHRSRRSGRRAEGPPSRHHPDQHHARQQRGGHHPADRRDRRDSQGGGSPLPHRRRAERWASCPSTSTRSTWTCSR